MHSVVLAHTAKQIHSRTKPPSVLNSIESILGSSITVWYSSMGSHARTKLQCIVNKSSKIIASPPTINWITILQMHNQKSKKTTTSDPSHPAHHLFQLMFFPHCNRNSEHFSLSTALRTVSIYQYFVWISSCGNIWIMSVVFVMCLIWLIDLYLCVWCSWHCCIVLTHHAALKANSTDLGRVVINKWLIERRTCQNSQVPASPASLFCIFVNRISILDEQSKTFETLKLECRTIAHKWTFVTFKPLLNKLTQYWLSQGKLVSLALYFSV